ncbi:hypothetical protein HKX48_005598 [Thoreauomyces humboldtii]|nr:hypothetical protein HKX48_005598 [Thoreauomyces humboldtii]
MPPPPTDKPVVSERDYHRHADATMDDLVDSLEALGEEIEVEGFDVVYASGVLNFYLGNKGTYVVNKQPPNRQIWLSSPVSGPKRFDYSLEAEAWLCVRTGEELVGLLNTELSSMLDPMRITPIPCLKDNYAYLLQDSNGTAVVVDPVEPHKVLPVVDKAKVSLKGILTTHHHADHAGGNTALATPRAGLQVWGSGDGRIPALTSAVRDKETFRIGTMTVTPLFVPGHTTGSVAFYVVDDVAPSEGAVFTGDTLFIGGCGRFFEGTPPMMYASLSTLAALPDNTKVYCGHEYTQANLKFAAHVEPSNKAVSDKIAWCEVNPCSVPSTIGEEKTYNPFLRTDSPEIRKSVGAAEGEASDVVLGKLRAMKDKF